MIDSAALLQKLVRQPSVFEQEHGIVSLIEQQLDGIGIARHSVPFDASHLHTLPDAQLPFSKIPDRRNVVAKIPGSGVGRSLILSCHLDVVPAGDPAEWAYAPFSGEIRDGVLFGRGAYDDKAGVAACLTVLERLASGSPLCGDVLAHFVLEDETTGNGSLLCLEAGFSADAAIIVDGTRGDRGINRHAGNAKFAVTIKGKAASVSVSHMGVNAVELLMELVFELRGAIFDLNCRNIQPWLTFPSPNQFVTMAVFCPERTLSVPETASAVCYVTFTPPQDLTFIRNLIGKIGSKYSAQVDWLFVADAVESESEELEKTISRAAGRKIAFGPSTGTSDMRHFATRGIPCVLFGPGTGYNPHRADERFHLDSFQPIVEILHKTAMEWCA